MNAELREEREGQVTKVTVSAELVRKAMHPFVHPLLEQAMVRALSARAAELRQQGGVQRQLV